MTYASDSTSSCRGRGAQNAYGVEPCRRKYKLRLARYKALAEAVAAFVHEKHPEAGRFKLLDVGVGSGRSMRYIESETIADAVDFYGFDLQRRRLARVYSPERWRLCQGDIQDGSPFPSACFDIVVFEQVLEHMQRPHDALQEIARVLKPDGLLVLGAPIFPWGISHLRQLFVGAEKVLFGTARSHGLSFSRRSLHRLVCVEDTFTIVKSYGFRIISGGVLSSLEDHFWWYRFNRWLGRVVPGLCTEIQIIAIRNCESNKRPMRHE